MSTTVFNEKINERTTLTCNTAYFTEKANINVADFYGILVVSTVTPDARLILENNITVSGKTFSSIYGIVSDTSLSVSAADPKKTIKVTASGDDFSARGIESRKNLDLNDFSANINVSGVKDAYGFYVGNILNAYRMSGKVTVAAKNSGDAAAYGLYAYTSDADNLTITEDISNVWSVAAKGYNATAYGICSENGIMTLGQVSGKITVTSTAAASGDARGIFDNCIRAVRSMILDGISGTITVKASGGSNSVCAYGVHSVTQLYATGDFTGNFTVSADAKSDANAEARGVYSGNKKSAGSEDIVAGDVTGVWKISAKGGKNTQAYALSAERDILLGDIAAKITVTETNTNKENSNSEKHCAAAFSAGRTFQSGDITGSITVTGTHASGLKSNNGITMGDLAGSTWKITAKNGFAYGFYTGSGDVFGEGLGKLAVSAAGGNAYGICSAGCIDFSDITGDKSITSKKGDASGFLAGSYFGTETISGKITVSGKEVTNGVLSTDSLVVNDMAQMNLKVTSSNADAYGVTSYNDLFTNSGELNAGMITVSGKQVVTGIYASNNLYTVHSDGEGLLTGTVSATSKAHLATGIEANAFSENDGSGRIKVGATIKASGKIGAYGIIFYERDLALEGAVITVKNTDKQFADRAYAVFSTDSSANTVSLSGNSKLNGHILLGDGTDSVEIESGSQLNGGLENVEKLMLKINDASRMNNALWNATESFGSVCKVDFDVVDYGLIGEFKLITKKSDMDWSDIIDSYSQNWYDYTDDLYSYDVYTKGNSLFLKAAVWEDLDTEVCYAEKRSSGVKLTEDKVIFTDKANMTVKGGGFCYDPGNVLAAAMDASYTTTLILDNNITLNSTSDEYNNVYGIFARTLKLISVNAAKTLKVTAKGDSLAGTGGYMAEKITLLGQRFLQNITVSDVKVGTSGSSEYAYGINSSGDVTAEGTIAGKFTISSKTADETDIYVTGINAGSNFEAEDISGQFKITGNSKGGSRVSGVTAGGMITLTKLSGIFDLSSTGTGDSKDCEGLAFDSVKSITVEDGFSGKITVNVKNGSDATASAFSSAFLTMTGKNTGTISLNASGNDGARVCGLSSSNTMMLSNYSGAITAKAVSNKSSVYAGAIDSMSHVTVSGDFAGKLTVSAQSKDKTGGTANACGISTGAVVMEDISGVWNISANGYDACAYGITALNNITAGDISGNKTITATGKNNSNFRLIQACGFYSHQGAFTAEKISGNITVTGNETAGGFCCAGDFSVEEMSGMHLKVTSKNDDAYGIYAGIFDKTSSGIPPKANLLLSDAGLDLGKITVNADRNVYGLHIMNGMIKAESSCLNNVLSGDITVTSKTVNAVGILAYEFDNVVCSATISATGTMAAIGVHFGTGDLIFDGAKITTKVTEKKNTVAYAVYSMSKDDNTIELTGKSKLVGNINTGDGDENEEDRVIIESGSKLVGALENVEKLKLKINDSTQMENSLWDAVESVFMTQVQLEIDIDYGLTGDFLLATKENDLEWEDVIDFKNANVTLFTDDTNLFMNDNSCSYGDLSYKIEQRDNDLFLSVAEKI